jgi:hypothetical protein
MGKNIKGFKTFQSTRKAEVVKEAVVEIDNTLKISNLDIKKSEVKSYISKVKEKTGKDLLSMFSLSDIAENIVKWALENGSTLENVPEYVLIGGDNEILEEPVEETEVDIEAELDTEEDTEESEESTDDFEEPSEEDSEEGSEEGSEEEGSEEGSDTDDEVLPL